MANGALTSAARACVPAPETAYFLPSDSPPNRLLKRAT